MITKTVVHFFGIQTSMLQFMNVAYNSESKWQVIITSHIQILFHIMYDYFFGIPWFSCWTWLNRNTAKCDAFLINLACNIFLPTSLWKLISSGASRVCKGRLCWLATKYVSTLFPMMRQHRDWWSFRSLRVYPQKSLSKYLVWQWSCIFLFHTVNERTAESSLNVFHI